MNIPKLRFPEFGGEWEVKKLDDIAKIERGRFSPRPRNDPRFYGGSIPFVQTSDVVKSNGRIRTYTQTLNHEGLKVSKLFPKGTILITIAANIGHTGILDEDMACPDSLIGIQCNHETSPEFLNYYLSTQQKRMDNVASEAAQKNINIEFLKPYSVPYTSIDEQEKIAGFLTVVDERIYLIDKKVEMLKQYKKGVMQKIFTQQIRFKDKNDNDYPDWQEKRLDSIADIKKGTQLNGDELEVTGAYPMLNGGQRPSGYTNEYNSDAHTVTISEGGNSCGYVSYMTEKFWSGGHLYTLLNLAAEKLFLYSQLKYKQEDIMRLRVGSGLPNIQKGDLGRLKLAVPSQQEQQKIADFLTSLDDKIDLERTKLEQAKQFKKSLLQRMFV